MALKITEKDGKLVLAGNINSVTTGFLKQHIKALKSIDSSGELMQVSDPSLWIE